MLREWTKPSFVHYSLYRQKSCNISRQMHLIKWKWCTRPLKYCIYSCKFVSNDCFSFLHLCNFWQLFLFSAISGTQNLSEKESGGMELGAWSFKFYRSGQNLQQWSEWWKCASTFSSDIKKAFQPHFLHSFGYSSSLDESSMKLVCHLHEIHRFLRCVTHFSNDCIWKRKYLLVTVLMKAGSGPARPKFRLPFHAK